MKLIYLKPGDWGASLHDVGYVNVSCALQHIDIYEKTSFYADLRTAGRDPLIQFWKSANEYLVVSFGADNHYGLFIGCFGSIQSWLLPRNEIENYIKYYFQVSHKEFFFTLVKSNKHIFLKPDGIKGMLLPLMKNIYGKNA